MTQTLYAHINKRKKLLKKKRVAEPSAFIGYQIVLVVQVVGLLRSLL
jgi:hypothetical protein